MFVSFEDVNAILISSFFISLVVSFSLNLLLMCISVCHSIVQDTRVFLVNSFTFFDLLFLLKECFNYCSIPTLLTTNMQKQHQHQQQQQKHDRISAGLEELIMGCTSTNTKGVSFLPILFDCLSMDQSR